MRWNSVRLKLTMWSVSVLAVALLACGGLLSYQVQQDLVRSVDKDLARYCRFFSERLRARQDGPPGSPPDHARGPRPPDGRGGFDRGGRPPDEGREGRPRGSGRPQPRVLTLDGKPAPPFTTEGFWDPATLRLSARAGRQEFSTVMVDDEPMRVLSVPLRGAGGRIEAVLQAARPLRELHWALERMTRTLLMLIPLSLLIAGAGGAFLTSRALRPVRRITQAAGTIEAQDLSGRLPVTGGDEFAELAATFNGMLERLERAFEQQRRFAADASHELRTPLAAIKVHTSLALRGERTPAQYRQALLAADRSVDTATRIVQDLLLLARSDTGRLGLRLAPTSVSDVLLRAVEAVEATDPSSDRAPIQVGLDDPALSVPGDSHHLVRLFTNLLENAVRHTPPDGNVRIAATGDEEAVTIEVVDTGEGIAPEHLPRVRERFYRVDDSRTRARGGTGLGLAICQSIVEAHGGSLAIESAPGHGTRVRVTLPRAESRSGAILSPVSAAAAAGDAQTERIRA